MYRKTVIGIGLILVAWITAYAFPYGSEGSPGLYDYEDYTLGDINSFVSFAMGSMWEYIPLLLSVVAAFGLYMAGRNESEGKDDSVRWITPGACVACLAASFYVLKQVGLSPHFGFYAFAACLITSGLVALFVPNSGSTVKSGRRRVGTELPPHIRPVNDATRTSRWE